MSGGSLDLAEKFLRPSGKVPHLGFCLLQQRHQLGYSSGCLHSVELPVAAERASRLGHCFDCARKSLGVAASPTDHRLEASDATAQHIAGKAPAQCFRRKRQPAAVVLIVRPFLLQNCLDLLQSLACFGMARLQLEHVL